MANFTVLNMQYVIGGGRSRIPRMPVPNASNPPGLGPIPGVAPIPIISGAGTGTNCYFQQPQPSYMDGSTTLYYAFTSMSGGSNGGFVTNQIMPASPPQFETIGSGDVVQLNVYLPHGGLGTGGSPGAIIDAFDETSGNFVNDIFVSVTPDNGAGDVTHNANYLGAFDTSASAEVVKAFPHINPSNINFDQWLIMPETGDASDVINMNDLTIGKASNVVAFAYYKYSKPMKENFKEYIKEYIDVVKDLSAELPKLVAEGDTFRSLVDPEVLASQIQAIASRLGIIERNISQLGNAFIQSQNRPEVGQKVADKANKRK